MDTNIKVTVKDNVMTITVPMGDPTVSSSGKNLLVASSRGTIVTDAKVNGKNVSLGFNAYIPAK